MNWQAEYESLVRRIGSITYGKERWFYQGEECWYDRKTGGMIDTRELEERICEDIRELEESY